jgi:ATP-dependent Lon protease
MEIIRVPGYTALEKREIGKRYLVPRQIKNCGLEVRNISFRSGAVDELIKFYTMESGVRELERVTGQVCRRLARTQEGQHQKIRSLSEKGETYEQKNSFVCVGAGNGFGDIPCDNIAHFRFG